MTNVLLDVPTGRRAFPQVFNRLVLILAFEAHLFALVIIVQSAGDYRSLPVCTALWLLSLAVPLACLRVGGGTGGLTTRTMMISTVAIVMIDLALAADVFPADRAGAAMWNWGAIAVTVLSFAAFRPARDVLMVAAMHGLTAVAVTAAVLREPGVGTFDLVVVANAATTPALAAAQYLGLYVAAVRRREKAVADQRAIKTRQASDEAIRADAAARLHALQAELIPLLEGISSGRSSAREPSVAALARRLGDDLRRELVTARSGRWLIPRPDGVEGSPTAGQVGILDPFRLLSRIGDRDRAALSALVGLLHGRDGGLRRSIALVPATRASEEGEIPSRATVTVTAAGLGAGAAVDDVQVGAAIQHLGAMAYAESPELLVAEVELVLTSPVLPRN